MAATYGYRRGITTTSPRLAADARDTAAIGDKPIANKLVSIINIGRARVFKAMKLSVKVYR